MTTQGMGDAVRLLRQSAGMSMRELARRCDVGSATVQQIENGAIKRPSPSIVHVLDETFGAAGTLTALSREDDEVKRRQLFAAISAVAAGANEYGRLVDGIAAPRPGRIGVSDAAAVEEAAAFVTALDLRHGGGAALGPARALTTWAVGLLDCEMADATERRMRPAVGALVDRVAWVHYDAGRDADAERLYGVAMQAVGTHDQEAQRCWTSAATGSAAMSRSTRPSVMAACGS